MKLTTFLGKFLVLSLFMEGGHAFAPTPAALSTTSLSATEKPTLTTSEEKVYSLLTDLHESKLDFRIVVVGNGAILESTNPLGPAMALNQSPKSGANLVTFASEDKSFEFHLQTAAVAKVALVEKEVPGRTMRILRFMNNEEKSICSLILSEDSPSTAEWYASMTEKYGKELVV